MRAALAMGVCVAGLAVVGCRAQVSMPDGEAPVDLGTPDLSGADLGPVDLAGVDQTCAGPIAPEICDNGCDDDHNGFADGDDPACTPQLLVTFQSGTLPLERLVLGAAPKTRILDGNLLTGGWFAEYQRAFAPAVFLSRESAPGTIRRLTLVPDGGVGSYTDYHPPTPGYSARDVCVFNGELIVVERGTTSLLHRFQSDGMTETGFVSLGAVLATACASDGKLLYVAVHDTAGNPSQFLVYDKSFNQVATIAMPASLVTAGIDRCLDFAWTQGFGFYGLFVASNATVSDAALSATQLYPFAFDGGVSPPIDAGTIHGLGEFLP